MSPAFSDVRIPTKSSPGWNLYLPIPFSKGCRIAMSSGSPKSGGGMIDWYQCRSGVMLNKGENQFLIKTNNRQNRDLLLWVNHCAVK